MARSQLRVHTRNWWSGRCTCGDPHPCTTRATSLRVTGETDPPPRPAGRTVVAFAVMAVGGGVVLFLLTWWVS
jgi:hypothetical protein